MTKENLKLANEKMEQVKEMQDFIKAFKEPYMNIIKASDFGSNGSERNKSIIISSNDELYNLILNYCESKLEQLKEEFQKI